MRQRILRRVLCLPRKSLDGRLHLRHLLYPRYVLQRLGPVLRLRCGLQGMRHEFEKVHSMCHRSVLVDCELHLCDCGSVHHHVDRQRGQLRALSADLPNLQQLLFVSYLSLRLHQECVEPMCQHLSLRSVQRLRHRFLHSLQQQLRELQNQCIDLHAVFRRIGALGYQLHMRRLRRRVLHIAHRQQMLPLQLELQNLFLRAVSVHFLSQRKLSFIHQQHLRTLWNSRHVDHTDRSLQLLPTELQGMRERHGQLHHLSNWLLLRS